MVKDEYGSAVNSEYKVSLMIDYDQKALWLSLPSTSTLAIASVFMVTAFRVLEYPMVLRLVFQAVIRRGRLLPAQVAEAIRRVDPTVGRRHVG